MKMGRNGRSAQKRAMQTSSGNAVNKKSPEATPDAEKQPEPKMGEEETAVKTAAQPNSRKEGKSLETLQASIEKMINEKIECSARDSENRVKNILEEIFDRKATPDAEKQPEPKMGEGETAVETAEETAAQPNSQNEGKSLETLQASIEKMINEKIECSARDSENRVKNILEEIFDRKISGKKPEEFQCPSGEKCICCIHWAKKCKTNEGTSICKGCRSGDRSRRDGNRGGERSREGNRGGDRHRGGNGNHGDRTGGFGGNPGSNAFHGNRGGRGGCSSRGNGNRFWNNNWNDDYQG